MDLNIIAPIRNHIYDTEIDCMSIGTEARCQHCKQGGIALRCYKGV